MVFLFRSPLLQFDIRNPNEVKAHWPNVLDSIRLSSLDLYNQIRDKEPENLSLRENMAVYKYLLRGRFRATPFGRWAGVGVAKWSEVAKTEVSSLATTLIEAGTSTNKRMEYWVNPSLVPWGDGWKFWNYDRENERWRYSKSEDSPIIQRLRSLADDKIPVNQRQLFAGFPWLVQSERSQIWTHLLKNQLLVSTPFVAALPGKCHEDHFILQTPEVSLCHKEQLDRLFSEIGKLAVPSPSPYFLQLKELFVNEFDDRFVPLAMLWRLVSQLDPFSKMGEERNAYGKGNFPPSLGTEAVIDLRSLDLDFGNSDKVSHVQGLFRVLEDGHILLDNLVYNRPYVYGGRFSHRPEVFEYLKASAYYNGGAIQADVELVEGLKASRISSHRSVSKFRINCFRGSASQNELDCDDIFIGIQQDRFKLVSARLGREVIPIFQHPLNPHFITHPICRILWEVGHQHLLKPVHYCHDSFLESDHLPQLNWGNIILQPQRWRLRFDGKHNSEKEMMELMSSLKIPKKIMVGQLDQELSLDLDYEMDRKVLIDELRKNRILRIHEWLWSSPVCQSKMTATNLQYVWGIASPSPTSGLKEDCQLNYLPKYESNDWVSVRIFLIPDFQQTMVMKQILLLTEELESAGIRNYFYLYYRIKNSEIRLRIKLGKLGERATVLALLYSHVEKMPDVQHIKSQPYYPEHAKYSEEGMPISEELFYQESRLLLNLNPKTSFEKLSLAVGIGGLLIDSDDRLDYWIAYFKKLSGESDKHHSPKDYQLEFLSQTTPEWRLNYASQAKAHPWSSDPQKRVRLIANHLHMLINRIFWETGLDMEPEVFSVLGRALRKKRFE
jgi:thiopeptide-type bacteriocin biosynthesis protein